MTRTPAVMETREIEPLTNDEAEAAFITLVTVLDKMGCAPAASVTSKEDEGVSFSLHFSADRARKLIANANRRTPAEPLADGEMIERNRIAIRNVGAFIVFAADKLGLQQIEDLRIVHGLAESAYNPNDRLREALEEAWTDFLDANPDDLNSPEEYPDHALVTFKQLVGIVDAALSHNEGRDRIMSRLNSEATPA